MKVKIEYIDNSAVSEEEVTSQMKHIFGSSAYVEVFPDDTRADTLIRHSIKTMITGKQVVSFFDDPKLLYNSKVRDLKVDFISFCSEIFDEVVEDNESRWT